MASGKPVIKLKVKEASPTSSKLKIYLKPKWTNPTTHCNWVFPGKLLIGAYPDPQGPYIDQLLKVGVTLFATLQTTPELSTFRDYMPLLPPEVIRIQLPIVDRKVASDQDLLQFIQTLRQHMDQGHMIYLHCHGGHGRSGTVATILLHQIEGLTLDQALFKANQQHQTRGYKPQVYIPQCKCQKDQVKRLTTHL